MFALKTRSGDWVRKHDGTRFTYSERRLARMAAKHLGKLHHTYYEVVDA